MSRFLEPDHARLIRLLGAFHALPVPLVLAQGLADIPVDEARALLQGARERGHIASSRPSARLCAAHGCRDGVALTARGRLLWRQLLQEGLQARGPVGARTRRAA